MPIQCPPGLTLLTGGARSGKSSLAERLARGAGGPVQFIATAEAGDDDMADRIARHQADRPAHWGLVEEPIELEAALAATAGDAVVIVDCLTLWTSNLFFAECTADQVVQAASGAARTAAKRTAPTLVVTNEVGFGLHPPTEIERRYRDVLGRVNRVWAERADRSWLVIAGRVVPTQDVQDLT